MKTLLSTIVATLISSQLNGLPGDVQWTFPTAGIVYSSPAIGPDNEIVFGSGDGSIYCLEANGSMRWTYVTEDWVDGSPAIANGTVYIGAWDDYLYALHLDSGNLKWKFATGSLLLASPAVDADENIYFGSSDSLFYSLNANGELRWTYVTDRGLAIDSSPALSKDGSTVYFGTDEGNLLALNTSNGSLRWSYSVPVIDGGLGVEIKSSPAIGSDGSIVFGCSNGFLYVLNPDGSLAWDFQAGDSIDSSPAISSDGTIVFASRDGYLYAIDSEGIQLWETLIGDVFYASPALSSTGSIHIGSYYSSDNGTSGTVFGSYSLEDGSINWKTFVSDFNDSSPNLTREGNVVVGSHSGLLYQLEGDGPLATNAAWPRFQFNLAQTAFDTPTIGVPDYLPQAIDNLDGWWNLSWFGAGWFFASDLPYVLHLDHETIFLLKNNPEGSLWFYDYALGWLYATETAPYYYFSVITSDWLLHMPGSQGQGDRWFYDFSGYYPTSDGWILK